MDPTRRVFLTAFVPGAALAGASLMGARSVLARGMQDFPPASQPAASASES